jgi:hypothetical protein
MFSLPGVWLRKTNDYRKLKLGVDFDGPLP